MNTLQQPITQVSEVSVPSSIKLALLFSLSLIVIMCLVTGTIFVDVIYLKQQLNEISLTEISQQLLLLFTAIRYFSCGYKKGANNKAYILAGSFFLVLLIREMDHFLDFIFHGFWKFPAITIALFAISSFIKNKQQSFPQLAEMLRSRFMPLLITAILMLLVFSRIAGMGDFWRVVMQDEYIRLVKNIVEEGSELFCYYMIAFSSLLLTRKN